MDLSDLLSDFRLAGVMVIFGVGIILLALVDDPLLFAGFLLTAGGCALLVNARLKEYVTEKWDRLK